MTRGDVVATKELIIVIRTGVLANMEEFCSKIQLLARDLAEKLSIEPLDFAVVDAWEPNAVRPMPQMAFGNNRVLDSSIEPSTDDEF
jgi:hypothetical protein